MTSSQISGDKNFTGLFWGLGAPDLNKRVKAAAGIISFLKKQSQMKPGLLIFKTFFFQSLPPPRELTAFIPSSPGAQDGAQSWNSA